MKISPLFWKRESIGIYSCPLNVREQRLASELSNGSANWSGPRRNETRGCVCVWCVKRARARKRKREIPVSYFIHGFCCVLLLKSNNYFLVNFFSKPIWRYFLVLKNLVSCQSQTEIRCGNIIVVFNEICQKN